MLGLVSDPKAVKQSSALKHAPLERCYSSGIRRLRFVRNLMTTMHAGSTARSPLNTYLPMYSDRPADKRPPRLRDNHHTIDIISGEAVLVYMGPGNVAIT